jgi:hypothetical protein
MAYRTLTAGRRVNGTDLADLKIDLALELIAQAHELGMEVVVSPRFDLGEIRNETGVRVPYLNAWAGARNND